MTHKIEESASIVLPLARKALARGDIELIRDELNELLHVVSISTQLIGSHEGGYVRHPLCVLGTVSQHYGHFLLFFFRKNPKHLHADVTLLRRSYELDFLVGSLKCANYRERLIRRRRIGGRHVPRVLRLEDNGVRHFSLRSLFSAHHRNDLRQEWDNGARFEGSELGT
jgi:hypothetical protein